MDETLKLIELYQARLKLLEKRLRLESRIVSAERNRDAIAELRERLHAVNKELEELEEPTPARVARGG